MANLVTQPVFEPGIYQLETTDPVMGGPDGVDNHPHRQLANRTAWLKVIADEVIAARGSKPSLNARLTSVEAAGGALAQGVTTLKHKFVINGFFLTQAGPASRTLHLSATGTLALGLGISRAQIDCQVVALPDDDYHVTVPPNPTNGTQILFAYVLRSANRVDIAPVVPDAALPLYRITLPPNHTSDGLAGVTITDMRLVQPLSGAWTRPADPFVAVALATPLPATGYAVDLDIESATNPQAIGQLLVYDRALNGFKIRMAGNVDNVRIRWTAFLPR